MTEKSFIWLFVLLTGWWAVGCTASSPTLPAVCDVDEGQTAVSLTLLDEQNAPLERVQVRYRLNDGPWIALPEAANGRANIPGGGGGYQIRAEKVAYVAGETAVIVPAALQPDCQTPTQQVTLQLAAAVCPAEPEPLTARLVAPPGADRLRATAITPNGRHISLTCLPDENGCQSFQIPLDRAGDYQFILERLPATAALTVADGLIDYDWLPYELHLTHRGQSQALRGERANHLTLKFNVAPDEEGCPQPDLRALNLTSSPQPDDDISFPPVSADQLGGMLMTDLGAEACRQSPEMKPVFYEIIAPAGTPLAEVGLLYWLDGRWQQGECGVENGRLLCAAQFPQPLIRQPYAVKAVVSGQEYTITQLPFDTLCILFR